MKTRDELIKAYLEDSGGTSGGQCLALMRLCKEMEDLGYARGHRDGCKQTGVLFDAVLGPRIDGTNECPEQLRGILEGAR